MNRKFLAILGAGAVLVPASSAAAHDVEADVTCNTVRVFWSAFPGEDVFSAIEVEARSVSDPLHGGFVSETIEGVTGNGSTTIPFSPALVGDHEVEVELTYVSDIFGAVTSTNPVSCPQPPPPPSVPEPPLVPPTAPEPPSTPVPPTIEVPVLPPPDNPCPARLVTLVRSGKAGPKWVRIARERGCVKASSTRKGKPSKRCPGARVWTKTRSGKWTCRRLVGRGTPRVTG